MREILFRGKSSHNGKWVEGYLGIEVGKISYIQWLEYADYCHEDVVEECAVDPETVGQYTGLTDKNGKKIFEGDIIEYNGTKHRVVFENRFQTAYFGIVMSAIETWDFRDSVPANMMEVIGNIHDNPELLER